MINLVPHRLNLRSDFPENWDPVGPLSHGLLLEADDRKRMDGSRDIGQRFASVISALCSTTLVRPIDARQELEAAAHNSSVPPILALLHTDAISCAMVTWILIETTSVKHEKETLRIPQQHLAALKRYCESASIPLLIAILWQKLQLWTVHTPDHFTHKTSTAKIGIRYALANDLSMIFSDSLVVLESGWIRRTIYNRTKKEPHLTGIGKEDIVAQEVSADVGSTFTRLDEVQSAMLNLIFRGKRIEATEQADVLTIVERNTITTATKLSSLVDFLIHRLEYGKVDGPAVAYRLALKFREHLQLPLARNLSRSLSPLARQLMQRVLSINLNFENPGG